MLLLRRTTVAIFSAIALAAIAAVALSFADARGRGLLFNTLKLAAGAVAVAAPVGSALGLALSRTDVWGRRAAAVLLGSMLLVPLYLQAAAWQAGFGIEGWQTAAQSGVIHQPWLDGWAGAIWVHGCAGAVWVALFVGIAARSVPRSWEDAAWLDLSAGGVFYKVTLRAALPAILLGGIWVALTTMNDMSVTDLFAVRTYVEELYIDLNLGSWNLAMNAASAEPDPLPALPGLVTMATCVVGVLMLAWGIAVLPVQGTYGAAPVCRLGRLRIWVSLSTWLAVGALVILPLGNLVYKAGAFVTTGEAGIERDWSLSKAITLTITSPRDHYSELRWSIMAAACTAAVALLLAVPLAHTARNSKVAGGLALLLATAGLAVPGPWLGTGLISLLNNAGSPALDYLYDQTIALMVLGQSVRAFPLVFFLVSQAFRSIPRAFTDVAVLDGAGPLGSMWLCVRARLAAVVAAGVAAAVVSLGEVAVTILVCPPAIEPLSVRIFTFLHYNVEDQLAAICLMLVVGHSLAAVLVIAMGKRAFATDRKPVAVGYDGMGRTLNGTED